MFGPFGRVHPSTYLLIRLQLWKNPATGNLHFQVHPCGVCELFVEPLPEGAKQKDALYPNGAHVTDLGTVRNLLYKMQRPAIAPNVSGLKCFIVSTSALTLVSRSLYTHTTGKMYAKHVSCFAQSVLQA